jgi:methionyl aminopeptidase
MTSRINLKNPEEIKVMKEGGRRLFEVKEKLRKEVKIGTSAFEIEEFATELIEKSGGKPSFKMVPNYHWSTCINVNSGIVHGVPKKEIIFKKGDVVSVDVGMFYGGFHTDTSFTVGLEVSRDVDTFLDIGYKTLKKAISVATIGNRIYDISQEIQENIEGSGYSVVRLLVGHGVGRELHEEPSIPCFVAGLRKNSPKIVDGMVLAVEVMYCMGKSDLKLDEDKWTISTLDGSLSSLFEESLAVTKDGPIVLTA